MTNLTGRTSLAPARVDRGFHRQPDAPRMRFQLLRIERDAHRQALAAFHPVARRILRWDQREVGACAAALADHLAALDALAAIIFPAQLDRIASSDFLAIAFPAFFFSL